MGKEKKKREKRDSLEELQELEAEYEEKKRRLKDKIRQEELKRKMQKGAKKGAKRQKTANPPDEPAQSRPSTSGGSSHYGQQLGKWTKQQVAAAWNDHQGGMSITKSAIKNAVPITTLKDKFRKIKKLLKEGKKLEDLQEIMGHCSGGKDQPRVFSLHQENLLTSYLLMQAESGFGLTPCEVRSLAHHWALVNGLNVEPDKSAMSYNWFHAFVERHPEIRILKPQELSLYRALAPSQMVVDLWFDNVANLYEKNNVTQPGQVWNIDETGLMDQPKAEKIITGRNTSKVQIVAGEKGQLTTLLCFASASGMVAQPSIIFKGVQIQDSWREFKPDGWNLYVSHNGWINKQIFLSTARKFLKFLEANGLLGRRHVILLDGHSSHSYNYAFVLLMAAHNISVVQFPAHCTHFMQPFDSCILSTLKRNWQNSLRIWNRNHAGQKMAKASFFIPFSAAWRKTMKPGIIQAAFRKTGMWPMDKTRLDTAWYKAREALGLG